MTRYKVILNCRWKGIQYYPGDILPDDFIPPENWVKCGVVKEITESKPIKNSKKKEDESCHIQED